MRLKLRTVLTTVFVAVMLVVGIDYVSFAATGGHALLGTINKANKTTTFKRTTAGPAVTLTTKTATSPPLATNGKGRVANLNADLLDGKDSSAFALNSPTKIYRFTTTNSATSHTWAIPVPSAGKYLVTYSVNLNFFGADSTHNENGFCEITQSTGIFGTFQASGYASASSTYSGTTASSNTAGVSATTVIDPSGFPSSLNLFCSASVNWVTPPTFSFLGTSLAQPAIVTVTKLNGATTTSASASRVSPSDSQRMQQRAQVH